MQILFLTSVHNSLNHRLWIQLTNRAVRRFSDASAHRS